MKDIIPPKPCTHVQKKHTSKAELSKLGNKMSEWSAVCPNCGRKHKRNLPDDAGYGACDFMCDCELSEKDTMNIINAVLMDGLYETD